MQRLRTVVTQGRKLSRIVSTYRHTPAKIKFCTRGYQTEAPRIELPASVLEHIDRSNSSFWIFVAILLPLYTTYKYMTKPDPEKIKVLFKDISDILLDIDAWRSDYETVVLEDDDEDTRVGVLGGAFAQVDEDGTINSYMAVMTQKQLKFVELYKKLVSITNDLQSKVSQLESITYICNYALSN
jgi:hypothetical protein